MDIKKVVIIGSGTMGSGIAAQVANAGISVTLLDLSSEEGSRNQITQNGKHRILNSAKQNHSLLQDHYRVLFGLLFD